jgi:hypothetical protein
VGKSSILRDDSKGDIQRSTPPCGVKEAFGITWFAVVVVCWLLGIGPRLGL